MRPHPLKALGGLRASSSRRALEDRRIVRHQRSRPLPHVLAGD